MNADLLAWTNLGIKWLHFIAGIAWIGASFYFVWLDNSLRAPRAPKAGVGGELWAVHGGGFYHNEKFLMAPPEPPEHLHWFKWEAYTTWLSGFALMILVYYVGAETYLIDRAKADIGAGAAVAVSLGALVAGWLVYDALCRSPLGKSQAAAGAIWFLLLVAAAFGLTRIFSDKAAIIHVGAIIGTVMVANVFLVIIPNQKKAVAAMIAGEKPDPALGAAAKQRSVHNNYMTLPVLLTMISGHYPLLIGHEFNWLLLAGLSAASVIIRHFFNLRHKGVERRWLVGASAALFVATIMAASIRPAGVGAQAATISEASDDAISAIMQRHCVTCHSGAPTHPAFSAPPGDLSLETLDSLRSHAETVRLQTVDSDIMPLGNETGMTQEERAMLGAWLAGETGEPQ